MKTLWTKGLEADAKKEMALHFNSSAQLRKRLEHILADKASSADRKSMADDAFDNGNWAYKQAYTQGYRRAMQEISSILK